MYCSHCGKKVTDTMLFCPFCGDPIVIPDQDAEAPSPGVDEAPVEAPTLQSQPPAEAEADAPEPPVTEVPAPEPESRAEDRPAEPPKDDAAAELLQWDFERRSLAGDEAEPEARPDEEPFAPLRFDEADEGNGEDWREEISRRKQAAAPEKKAPEMRLSESQAVRLDGRAPALEGETKGEPRAAKAKTHRAANTYVPAKAMDPGDIFMDDKPDAYDSYDAYDDFEPDAPEDDFEYEEEREGSFLMRHIRGIVGLALLVVLALLFIVYTFTNAGQKSLARMNLAWNPSVYAGIAYEYYQNGQYTQAGQYYERALARDADNYAHASSAAMSYVSAKNTDKAAAMLKKCIEIDPNRVEPYVYLLNLYPEAADRPWDVTQLIRNGYQLTGDGRLDVAG